MSITRRQALAGSAASAAALATGVCRPAIAAKEPIQIGYLPALTGPCVVHRRRHQSRRPVGRGGDQRGRRHRWPPARADQPRHAERSDQGGERRRRAHARHKVSVVFGPVNSGEALAALPLLARANVPAAASLLGRLAGRPEEISDVLPQRPDQPADRRRRQPLCGRGAEEQEGRGHQRHHRLRHGLGRRLCADAQDHGRRRRLPGQHVDAANPDVKPEMLRMQAAGAEAIMPWSVNAGFLSRLINTRGQMGWDVPIVRPDHARLRPDQGAARKAGILGQGLSEQFPPGLLRRRRQASATHGRFRRPSAQRQGST